MPKFFLGTPIKHICRPLLKSPVKYLLAFIFFPLVSVGLSSCSSMGQMSVLEQFYIAVPSGENTNYFRVTVSASSSLSKSDYQSGWFPAEAVDRLYGNNSSGEAAKKLLVERKLKKAQDDALLKVRTEYLKAATDPKSSEERILALLNAERRIRASAGDRIKLPEGALEIEYDPFSNLVLRHAGEKFVIAFTANPDDVLRAIKGFANTQKSGATILRLSEVIQQQSRNEADELEAEESASSRTGALVVNQMTGLEEYLESNASAVDAQKLKMEIEALLMLLENAR